MKFEGKWIFDANNFRDVCLNISQNLTDFKRKPIFTSYIANDIRNIKTAEAFYTYIKINYPYLFGVDFSKNDEIGSPCLYKFDGKYYSPGTLRFMKVIGDINEISKNINKIVEIGSGYGGQSLVYSLYKSVDYTCIDITETLTLAKAYHKANNYNSCNYLDSDSIIEDNYDLCISDYCLSELDLKGIDFYLDNVLSNCRYAYITANSHGERFDYLINKLHKYFTKVDISVELPKTTHHDNHIIKCIK